MQILLDSVNYTPYKNRYIAIIGNQVVGVGLTSVQAYQAAKVTRSKERPHILFVDKEGTIHMQPQNFNIWFQHKRLKQIISILSQRQQEVYLVGGAVRDGLLGYIDPKADIDLLVPKGALKVAKKLADKLKAAYYPVDANRDVGRVVLPGYDHIDVASYRGESLTEDLADRDFTINAIALKLDTKNPQIIDPLNGQYDLQQKVIRIAKDDAVERDPLRAVRAVRLAAKFNFTIAPQTKSIIEMSACALQEVSAERLRDEVLKLLQHLKPGQVIKTLHDLNLLCYILPEALPMIGVSQSLPHHLPVFEHTLLVMDYWPVLADITHPLLAPLASIRPQLLTYFQTPLPGNLSRAELMPIAALMHDIGKPDTFLQGNDGRIRFWQHPQIGAKISKQIMTRWRFSGQVIRFVATIVVHHMRPLFLAQQQSVSSRAIYRFLEATGDTAPAIAFLALLDHLGTYKPNQGQAEWQSLLQVVLRICQAYFTPKISPLLSGTDLIRYLNVTPGPQIGILLRKLKEAQSIGQVTNKKQALEFVNNLYQATINKPSA